MVNAETRGNNLRLVRKANGYTQEKLSQKLYVSQNNYGYYESGRNQNLDLLYRVADYFGFPEDQTVIEKLTNYNLDQDLFPFALQTFQESRHEKVFFNKSWQAMKEIYYEYHRLLRNYPDWIEVSDYYLALYKMLGIDREGGNRNKIRDCGADQLLSLAYVGNRYAKALMDTIKAQFKLSQ